MALNRTFRRSSTVMGACVVSVVIFAGSALANIISTTATLPLLGVPYATPTGADCFSTAGLCVTNGSLTLTSVVSSTFNATGQDIVTDATYAATLTTLGHSVIGLVGLSGTVEQEILGRTFSTETGSWTTEVVALSLSGPVQGHTLTLTLDSANNSTGTTSINPIDANDFSIGSFFDVFVQLTLDSTPPLHTTEGPLQLDITPAPEPTSLALLGLPLLLVHVARRQRVF